MPSLPDLLAAATPRPWERRTWPGERGGYATALLGPDEQIVASVRPEDGDLAAYAVNLAEAHAAVAEAAQWVRDCRGIEGLDDQFEAALDKLQIELARLAEAEKEQGT